LATLAVFFGVTVNAPAAGLNALFVCVVIGSLLVSLVDVEPIETAALRSGWSIAGPLYVGGLFGVIAQLFQFDHGGEWVLLACLCGFWSDTGGYFAGRKFGNRKLYERVSPKKTWEGSAGGLLGALIGGLLVHFFFLSSVPFGHIVVLSLVAAAAGQAGDLCESLIKRSVGVKDSGTILPGHGGILDRADALLFASAVIWAYVQLFGG
jgi:phosphatidate cytidylyltransferase